MISLSIFLTILCAALGDTTQARFATPCTTPNNDNGYCVEIQHCSLFHFSDLFNPYCVNHDFVIASKCGPPNERDRSPKVCCGEYSNFLNRISTTTEVPLTPPPPAFSQISPFPEQCGNQSITLPSRILGGNEVSLTEFPWMARLRHRSASGFYTFGCAGFLISEYFVMTAAHCIASKTLTTLGPIVEVQLGEHNTETNPDCEKRNGNQWCADFPQFIKIGKPKMHPEYSDNNQYHNDIALLPLKEPAEFTEFVYPICLATELSQENEMWLAGWGRTETGPSSPIKLKVLVRRATKNYCVPLYRNIGRRILYSQICAGGEPGVDSCAGDSGGPLMIQVGLNTWYAEGVVSFGYGCGIKDWPAVYTSIPYHIPWITKTMKHYLKRKLEPRQVTLY
ncbi:hypothetical protein PPYR_15289 [Photinus pyralis]|uniref:CLIP domain-containing serine protease n=2 Tax=Photinus pyralis TaxID=7054 RepID=A0A5N3ZZ47_PHOPY|nr:phenoloxidase-activating factor 1-like isoform X1 [Photinus pyralis]KAB0790344.1 hypothetical protein PPYR_15289 [Photinus pyralis]